MAKTTPIPTKDILEPKILGLTFSWFKPLWAPLAGTMFFGWLLNIVTIMAVGGIIWGSFTLLGTKIESILLTMSLGGSIPWTLLSSAIILLLIVITLVLAIGAWIQIALVSIIKNHQQKSRLSFGQLILQEPARFFWRYAWLSCLVGWYVLWPMLATFLVLSLIFIGVSAAGVEMLTADLELAMKTSSMLTIIMLAFLIIGGTFSIFFTIYRSVRMIFAFNLLVQQDCSARQALQGTLAVSKGQWWTSFGYLALLVAVGLIAGFIVGFALGIITALGLTLELGSLELLIPGAELILVDEILQTAINLVVIPFSMIFLYLAMFRVAAKNDIKL